MGYSKADICLNLERRVYSNGSVHVLSDLERVIIQVSSVSENTKARVAGNQMNLGSARSERDDYFLDKRTMELEMGKFER